MSTPKKIFWILAGLALAAAWMLEPKQQRIGGEPRPLVAWVEERPQPRVPMSIYTSSGQLVTSPCVASSMSSTSGTLCSTTLIGAR